MLVLFAVKDKNMSKLNCGHTCKLVLRILLSIIHKIRSTAKKLSMLTMSMRSYSITTWENPTMQKQNQPNGSGKQMRVLLLFIHLRGPLSTQSSFFHNKSTYIGLLFFNNVMFCAPSRTWINSWTTRTCSQLHPFVNV